MNELLDGKAEGFTHEGDETGVEASAADDGGDPIHEAEDDIARFVNPNLSGSDGEAVEEESEGTTE